MREQDLPVLESYAEALIEAAREGGVDPEALLEETARLRQLLAAQPRLALLLGRPAVRREEKQELLRTVFGGRVLPLLLNLGLLLVDQNRGALWQGVLEQVIEQLERAKGIFPCRVETAHELPEADRQRLRESLEAYTGHRLHMYYLRNASLIGGVRVRYGDLMIDNTVVNDLKEIRARLESVKIG